MPSEPVKSSATHRSTLIDRVATVFIPSQWRERAGGNDRVDVEGTNVRQIIGNLDQAYPGFRALLIVDDLLSPRVQVSVDGYVTRIGLMEKVLPASEVHFLVAISGG